VRLAVFHTARRLHKGDLVGIHDGVCLEGDPDLRTVASDDVVVPWYIAGVVRVGDVRAGPGLRRLGSPPEHRMRVARTVLVLDHMG
jgi:hypothetical protein